MLYLIAQATPLPRRVFEGDSDFCVLGGPQHMVQSLDDPLQSGRFTLAQMRARMQNQKRQPKASANVIS